MLEISQMKSMKNHQVSYFITCLFMVVILIGICLIPVHYFKYRRGTKITSKHFSELYGDTKEKPICKLYTLAFILRRFFTAFSLIAMRNYNIWYRCIAFTFLQYAALTYAIMFRPFAQTKHNLIEIMNEAIFSLLCTTISIFNSSKMWFGGLSKILIYTLTVNGSMISVILFVSMAIGIFQKCKNRRNKRVRLTKVQQIETPRNQRIVTKTTQLTKNSIMAPQIRRIKKETTETKSFESFSSFRDNK